MAWSADGAVLASGSDDRTVRLWAAGPAASPGAALPALQFLGGFQWLQTGPQAAASYVQTHGLAVWLCSCMGTGHSGLLGCFYSHWTLQLQLSGVLR